MISFLNEVLHAEFCECVSCEGVSTSVLWYVCGGDRTTGVHPGVPPCLRQPGVLVLCRVWHARCSAKWESPLSAPHLGGTLRF